MNLKIIIIEIVRSRHVSGSCKLLDPSQVIKIHRGLFVCIKLHMNSIHKIFKRLKIRIKGKFKKIASINFSLKEKQEMNT